jgi:hypothetical protein
VVRFPTGEEIYLFSKRSRHSMLSNQLPNQWAPGGSFEGGKTDLPPHLVLRLRNSGATSPLPHAPSMRQQEALWSVIIMPTCSLVATVVFCLATSQDENDMLYQVPDDSLSQSGREWELYVCSFYLRHF